MKSAVLGVGCWFAILGFVVYHGIQGFRTDRLNQRRQMEAHRRRVAEYERVTYPLTGARNRMGPRRHPSFYTCEKIWQATVELEERDREEWKRAAQ